MVLARVADALTYAIKTGALKGPRSVKPFPQELSCAGFDGKRIK
jgi:hypothetical protein